MRRLLVVGTIVTLVASSTALANHLDPQKKIRPDDQARARAMLLRKADFGPGTQVLPASQPRHSTCERLDQSDLKLTGQASSGPFIDVPALVLIVAGVYESVSDADKSWKRQMSSSGTKCVGEEIRLIMGQGGSVSFKRISFPRIAPRTVAYRLVYTIGGDKQFVAEAVVLQRSRAQAMLLVASAAATPPTKAEEVRLARLIAKRMARVMRGS